MGNEIQISSRLALCQQKLVSLLVTDEYIYSNNTIQRSIEKNKAGAEMESEAASNRNEFTMMEVERCLLSAGFFMSNPIFSIFLSSFFFKDRLVLAKVPKIASLQKVLFDVVLKASKFLTIFQVLEVLIPLKVPVKFQSAQQVETPTEGVFKSGEFVDFYYKMHRRMIVLMLKTLFKWASEILFYNSTRCENGISRMKNCRVCC